MEKKGYNNKYKDTITEIGKAAITENKRIKREKKELIKSILMKAGYDPTIRYTRKEKKKFTRIVKNSFYSKPKQTTILTDEQYKAKFKAEREAKKQTENQMRTIQLPVSKDKQRPISAEEFIKEETPKKRKFRCIINRQSDENPNKVYDFKTDYFEANTRKEAKIKALTILKEYERDTSFRGVTVHDINGDNSIIYYTRDNLKAA